MSLTIDSTIKLAGGGLLPRLGYGVYQARGEECTSGVKEAIKIGYRHSESPPHSQTGPQTNTQSIVLRRIAMKTVRHRSLISRWYVTVVSDEQWSEKEWNKPLLRPPDLACSSLRNTCRLIKCTPSTQSTNTSRRVYRR